MAQQNPSGYLENHLNSLVYPRLLGCSAFRINRLLPGAMDILRDRIGVLKSEQYYATGNQ